MSPDSALCHCCSGPTMGVLGKRGTDLPYPWQEGVMQAVEVYLILSTGGTSGAKKPASPKSVHCQTIHELWPQSPMRSARTSRSGTVASTGR
eukprot:301671-Amphidinium_carterae.3